MDSEVIQNLKSMSFFYKWDQRNYVFQIEIFENNNLYLCNIIEKYLLFYFYLLFHLFLYLHFICILVFIAIFHVQVSHEFPTDGFGSVFLQKCKVHIYLLHIKLWIKKFEHRWQNFGATRIISCTFPSVSLWIWLFDYLSKSHNWSSTFVQI